MKGSNICVAALIIFALLVLPVAMSTRNIADRRNTARPRPSAGAGAGARAAAKVRPVPPPRQTSSSHALEKARKAKGAARGLETVEVAGSSLPDCAHACGSCAPCRLVMVSFVCASLAEAETCPMAYKCMCRNKSFPVP